MLLALACLSQHGIIHRDIKPENILYDFNEHGYYHFRLGDFGLSNHPEVAKTIAGTAPFMAPEVYNRQPQSTRIDIWSLFATLVWVRNEKFRKNCAHAEARDIHKFLWRTALGPDYIQIKDMANLDPTRRPSAKRLLKNVFDITVGTAEDEDREEKELADQLSQMSMQNAEGTELGGPSYEPYLDDVAEHYVWEMASVTGQSFSSYFPSLEPRGIKGGKTEVSSKRITFSSKVLNSISLQAWVIVNDTPWPSVKYGTHDNTPTEDRSVIQNDSVPQIDQSLEADPPLPAS
jgi:serine/threonine protein kinase